MKILHITTTRELGSGQRAQLSFEHSATKKLTDVHWTVVSLHCDPPETEFERQIPFAFRNILLIRLYGWIYAIKNRKDYDIILFRDLQLDPFGPLLGWWVPNRVTVHHSLEIAELKLLKKPWIFKLVAVGLEKLAKPITQRSALGLAGISKQVVEYELERFPWLRERAVVYPNGAEISQAAFENDRRVLSNKFQVAFVASVFTEWHGLDRLCAAISNNPEVAQNFTFHLAGRLSQAQIEAIQPFSKHFVLHGPLNSHALFEMLCSSDLALDSLALDRQGLREASTLKTRSYLNAGLPVYANHIDTAFSEEFPFYRYDHDGLSLQRLEEFALETSNYLRSEIRERARPLIEKREIMEKVIQYLQDWKIIHGAKA